MAKPSPTKTPDRPGGGIENRSRVFARTGYGLAWLILATFALTFVAVEIGTARWRELIFGGLAPLGEGCTLAVNQGTGFAPASPVKIPHPGQPVFAAGSREQKIQLRYDCMVPPLETGKVLPYAHWGWVVGDLVEVLVDGRNLATYSGSDKPVFAVHGGEHVQILVHTTGDKAGAAGLIGNQPAVIAKGFRQNTTVMGVEILVSILRSLNFLLPLLSLGMMISLAWFSGYRVRTLTMAMYLLSCMTIFRLFRASYAFVDSVMVANSLAVASHYLYGLSLCLLMMETCRVLPKRIYPIARVGTLAIVCFGAWLVFHPGIETQLVTTEIYLGVVGVALGAIGFTTAWRLHRAARRPLGQAAGAAASVVSALIYAFDFVQYVNGDRSPLSVHLDGFVPIVAAIVLLYAFSRSEKKFQSEKKTSAALSERVVVEQTKHATLSRFLPLSLVNRFNDHGAIEEQLKLVLEPRRAKVAIFQADLRGFSKLVGDFELNEVLKLLSACFGPVVDRAQKFAMVKVIGDCLFAFVEEQPGEKSPTDYCLDIASSLLVSVKAVNANLNVDQYLRFGIGINYGETFIGNLSSENCIDYTAIGDAVNMTARLEEATKDESVATTIGVNGILMSRPAFENLKVYSHCGAKNLTLANGLRSYPLFKAAYFLTAEACAGSISSQSHSQSPARPCLHSAA